MMTVVEWTCRCGFKNEDIPEETSTPLCSSCGKETEWTEIEQSESRSEKQ